MPAPGLSSGWLRQMVPQKLGLADLAPVKLGVAPADPFGATGAFAAPGTPGLPTPQKIGSFGDAVFGAPDQGIPSPFGGIAKIGPADLTLGAIGQSATDLQQSQQATQQATPPPGTQGVVGQATGEYSVLNQYDTAFAQAAAKFGIPANVLKAIAENERGWEGTSPDGAVGIMQVMPQYWGDAGYDIYDPTGNIMAGALAYKTFYDQYHDEAVQRGVDPYVAAAGAYLAGNPWSTSPDYFGSTASSYGQAFSQHLAALNTAAAPQNAASTFLPGGGMVPATGASSTTANQIVGIAEQYVGVPYVWGGIPGKGDNPWDSGWDCSGFMYFLDQNYGTGQLPMGSHYQFQYAQQTGKLFTDTNQLQPGDLIFLDTGPDNGGGAELNRAGHVAMYLGNGQVIQAANPSSGTIITDLNAFLSTWGTFLGAMHMPWSGGSGVSTGAYAGAGTGTIPAAGATGTQGAVNRMISLIRGG